MYIPGMTFKPPVKKNPDVKGTGTYYGGKLRDADRIIRHLPPHMTYVEVFGGFGNVLIRKGPSRVDVYNDAGNVSRFFQVLRDQGEELYRRLYLTPFSSEELFSCIDLCKDLSMLDKDPVEWARCWYTVIMQSYTHEESADSFHTAVVVNAARAFANHVEDIPFIVERMRHVIIEHLDFRVLIPRYDRDTTLFYCDPPYLPDVRVDNGNYNHEMRYDEHIEFLELVQKLKGQVIVSGYDSNLYNSYLKDWRTVQWTHKSSIQNSKQLPTRGNRTEKLWIKEHSHGLWSASF